MVREYVYCPKGHGIEFSRNNYAKDFSDGEIDADCRPMFEQGLYCIGCERPYGLKKLIFIETSKL